MFFVVGGQVVEGKTIVGTDKINAISRLMMSVLIEVGTASEASLPTRQEDRGHLLQTL